jgi:hypothetical protein
MKGIVEVYEGDSLIYSEQNMLVDGASRLLADIMTVSPSLSSINHLGTSAILDASNYRIQAISFGKGNKGYTNNAHSWTIGKAAYFVSTFASLFNPVILYKDDTSTSSYTPINDFVDPPTPMDSLLTEEANVSAVNVFGQVLAFSSIIQNMGHNLNLLPPLHASNAIGDATIGTFFGGQTASVFGCYAEASGVGSDYYIFSSEAAFTGGLTSSVAIFSGTYSGLFNSASSMDMYGFVNMAASAHNDARYALTNPYGPNPSYSGLILSASPDLSSNGEIQYIVTIGSGDVGMANLYGGIYNIGLWYIDMEDTLRAGTTPPFPFRTIFNPRKYRLFSKKSFSKNILQNKDNGTSPGIYNPKDIRIVWRIKLL